MDEQKERYGLRTLVILMAIAILLVGGAGIAKAAAQGAIPGDALYPVKTTIEQASLTLAQDAGNRAEMRMAYAEQRLVELAALVNEGRHREIGPTVLAFEEAINSAILELETVSEIDPARAAQIAGEITATLTRYAQTLASIAANAPESVKPVVDRALDTTNIVGTLELPTTGLSSDDNSNDNGNVNSNANDSSSANANGDDSLANSNDNTNGDDSSTNGNTNMNGDDSAASSNDDGLAHGNDNTNSNANSNDDATNTNTNGDDSAANSNTNMNGDDGANSNDNPGNNNANSNDDSGNANTNDDGSGNTNRNGNEDNSNHNGDD
jgi:hypothetical protein